MRGGGDGLEADRQKGVEVLLHLLPFTHTAAFLCTHTHTSSNTHFALSSHLASAGYGMQHKHGSLHKSIPLPMASACMMVGQGLTPHTPPFLPATP